MSILLSNLMRFVPTSSVFFVEEHEGVASVNGADVVANCVAVDDASTAVVAQAPLEKITAFELLAF